MADQLRAWLVTCGAQDVGADLREARQAAWRSWARDAVEGGARRGHRWTQLRSGWRPTTAVDAAGEATAFSKVMSKKVVADTVALTLTTLEAGGDVRCPKRCVVYGKRSEVGTFGLSSGMPS